MWPSLCLAGIILLSNSTTGSAQLREVFSGILGNVSGMNGWVSHPSYFKLGDGPDISAPWRYGFSLKYGPFELGSKGTDTSYLEVNRRIVRKMQTDDGCDQCEVQTDSLLYKPKSDGTKDTLSLIRLEETMSSTDCDPCCPSRSVISVRSEIPSKTKMTLIAGYTYMPKVEVVQDTSLKGSFPLGGFFIHGVVTLKVSEDVGFSIGGGGTLLAMGKGTGWTPDTTTVRRDSVLLSMESAVAFAPQVFAGVFYKPWKSFSIFLDVGLEYARFGSISYSVVGEAARLKEFYPRLPESIEMTNHFWRLGVSLTTSSK